MKNNYFSLALLSVFSWVVCAESSTNVFFVTTEGSMITDTNGHLSMLPEEVEAALHAPECRPSEQDIDGNWGIPVAGFQLSARFLTNRFAPGDKVVATVFLRNVATNDIWFVQERSSGKFFKTVLSGPDGSTQKRTDFHDQPTFQEQLSHLIVNPKTRFVLSRTQIKWDVEVNDHYDLSASGKYALRVEQVIPSTDGKTNTAVTSGMARFEIIPPNK